VRTKTELKFENLYAMVIRVYQLIYVVSVHKFAFASIYTTYK